jgi:hypothetical protein
LRKRNKGDSQQGEHGDEILRRKQEKRRDRKFSNRRNGNKGSGKGRNT